MLMTHLPAVAQNKNPRKCGSEYPKTTAKGKYSQAQVNNMVSSLKHDTCLNKKFSIVFYVVLDSDYTWEKCQIQPCFTATDVPGNVAKLNQAFKRICVSFENCSTVTIKDFNYNQWNKLITDTVVSNNHYTDKTINVYIVGQIATPAGMVNGYTYFPGTGKDMIVITKWSMQFDSTELTHQMGHFFGLPDTYAEIGSPVSPGPPTGVASYEYVSRTNCYQHGDGFCDTEADCYPLGWLYNEPNCDIYLYGNKDGNNEYYRVPTDNFMSEYKCRCQFSQEQYNFMARTILTQRLYLH